MNSSQKIFGYTEIINFRDICLEKQQNELPDNLFEEEHFFEIISKLNYRYPFVYFPELLKDYFGGFFTKKLNKKHHLSSGSELRHIINSILKMEHTREKSKDRSSLEENITKTKNKLLYPNLLQLSQKYSEEISLAYNYNLLRGFLISYLLESNSKSCEKNNFLTYVNSNLNLIHTLEEEDIYNSFLNFLNQNIEIKITKIIKHLKKMNIISSPREGRIYLSFSKELISKSLIVILNNAKSGMYHNSFQRALLQKHPFLLLFPNLGIWESEFEQLEKLGEIVRIKAYWKFSPSHDQLFTKENIQIVREIIKNEDKQNAMGGRIKFCGRTITPDNFIGELLELEKGDFDANDDQVTRIAGLILAESVKLQAPVENIPMFDFSMDVGDYRFRQEQIDAMNVLDFQLNSKILHCKVMIDKKISKKLIDKLKKDLPKNHQGVIISFTKIPKSLQLELDADRTIQVIDEYGIRVWASISSILPSRVSSISKIKFDPFNDLSGNIARIDSMNYETGMANITTIPQGNEFNVYIRSLEEIPTYSTPQNFLKYSDNYFKFLKILSKLSDEGNFKQGIFNNSIIDHERKSQHMWILKTLDHTVTVNLFQESIRDILDCGCFSWKTDSSKLCIHLVSALDFIVRNGGFLDVTWGTNYFNTMIDTIFFNWAQDCLDVLLLDLPENKHNFLKIFFEFKQSLIELSN